MTLQINTFNFIHAVYNESKYLDLGFALFITAKNIDFG